MATTYTYFIGQGSSGSLVKIGKSTDPDTRLKSIQAASPVPLKILGVIPQDIEVDLHAKFKDLREHGEWFRFEGNVQSWVARNCSEYIPREHRRHFLRVATSLRNVMPTAGFRLDQFEEIFLRQYEDCLDKDWCDGNSTDDCDCESCSLIRACTNLELAAAVGIYFDDENTPHIWISEKKFATQIFWALDAFGVCPWLYCDGEQLTPKEHLGWSA